MSLKISRILHAGYVFECENTKIAFDTIFENPFSRNCHAFPNVEFDEDQIRKLRFDAVFISHFHDDHCSFESLNLLDRQTPLYVFCVFEELFSLIKELGFTEVYSLDLNLPVQVGPFRITPRRALDADVDSIFHIQAQGLNILNVVDSWIDPETLNKLTLTSPWDLVLWPFQTMRELEVIAPSRSSPAEKNLPNEWEGQLKALNPRYLVPSSCQFSMESWSWYNQAFFPISYADFQKQAQNILPQTKIVRMNPSCSFTLDQKNLTTTDSLPWIKPVGDQNVDYSYNPNLLPPKTGDVAKNFEALSEDQLQIVLQYCQSGMSQRFQMLEASSEFYFSKDRFWKLAVYDHQGKAKDFFYRISEGQIVPLEQPPQLISWLTEVPVAKLYAALEFGEALTSMYLRVNDTVFDAETEEQIRSVEIVEDPLIRTLFSDVFGAYQLAQLKMIQKQG